MSALTEDTKESEVLSMLSASYEIAGASDPSSLIDALGRTTARFGAEACILFRLSGSETNAEVLASWNKGDGGAPPAGTRLPRVAL